ncbi:Ig-like domain-containing protein [Microbacterium sp. STN6]|uniref:Ig-like domain-containing protein n=1 Tax=Microbacterium sp. STN6 TaxID=2995588 RepID=UPI002260ADF4|nr:Ig-like domain-containing protein [Microbacterium sp. STN6]MCX7522081.1 Ig-like domain-containing protein [Microbacterium sp. STN6]
MGAFTSWVSRRRRLTTAVAIVAIVGVPVTFALLHQGFPRTDPQLNARDVWVTNGTELLGGRLNHQIGELDAKVNGASSHLDVLQDGGATLLTDTAQGTVQVIDPAYVSLTEKISIPVGAHLSYGKDTLAVLSRSGSLWVLDASEHLTFDATATKPAAKLGPDAQVVVTKSGVTFALSPSQKRLYRVERPGQKATTADFPVVKHYQLSAVGDTAVVLDTDAQRLLTADGTDTRLGTRGLKLQQPGPDNDVALVATGTGLLRVPLGGGDTIEVPAGIKGAVTDADAASAPVYLAGCAYGAWAGAQRYLYACDGAKPTSQSIGQPVTASQLEFRVNHGVIALNDLGNGNAWIVSSNMRLVNNWAQVNPDRISKDGQTGKERPVKQSFEDAVAHRTTVNRSPTATDDTFGARPQRTTVLPVLTNDTDPDGDVLTITSVTPVPEEQGRLEVIEGGRALQFTPASSAASSVSFRYTIADGRGGVASAQVNVSVVPAAENSAPVAVRSSAASVEVGQSISHNVLTDWIDPDGDDIYLVGAEATTADSVTYTAAGDVTFTSKTGQTGSKQVTFTVSDGRTTATGSLMIDVAAADSLDPVAVPDYATAFVASEAVVHPLDNDLSPSGASLTLLDAALDSGGAGTVSVNRDDGTISFRTNAAGSYYLSYSLAAGSHSTKGIVLLTITNPPAKQLPPIAVKDIAYVRPGEPTTVNVLDNDVSPSGRVLVLQSVAKGADAAALNVEVLADSVVRITSPTVLAGQVQLTYTISDGYGTASAGITIVPIPPLVDHQPPIAEDDAATVRAGDIASVPVLDNDLSPDNEPFTLDETLVDASGAGDGADAFVSGSLVRYQAPSKPGTYSVTYGITDKFDQKATASLTFTVTAPDREADTAPKPRELTGRAFAGAAVDIVVPLDGIDPEGDSVSLRGIATAPALGRITKTTGSSFTYQAYAASVGTDTFTYTVEDTYGKSATGTVNIGIIPRPSTVKPPTAVDDHVEVKPGKTASVPVLLNDSDPNGYVISLEKKLPEVQQPLKARVVGGNVLVTAPVNEGAWVIRYQITNGQGGSATAFIQVVVTKDATPVYPTAVDHVIELDQLTGKSSITVDVLDGARNPSGLVDDLTVATDGPNADAARIGDDGRVTVTPGQHRMAITYALTDTTTGLAGKAFIIVPPKPGSPDASTAKPRIKPSLAQQVVPMNGTISWKLSEIIDLPSGRPATITGASGTTASNSNGHSPYVDAHALTFTPKKDYRGPAAITFRVNDGREPGTASDRITMLTLPITVGKPDQTDVPPTFTPPNLTIEAGEAAQTIDLRDSSFHPNPEVLQALQYRGFADPSKDIQASLAGSKLTVSAPFGVQPGTTATLTFTVAYKDFAIPGSVNVRVVSSTRPVATQKNPPQQLELRRGTAGGITLKNAVSSDYWINPFPDKPLTITDAASVSAPAGVTVAHTDSSITVVAGTAAASGRVNVTYRVQDATKDPQRVQIGQLTVSIHDVPDAPPAPSKVTATDRKATMTIVAPKSDNGKTISSYTLSWNGGTKRVAAPGTYTVTGLTNGTAYSFAVVATNADGNSASSAKSATVTPYGTPSAPRSAKITASSPYSPSDLTLSWSAPSDTGGGAVTYEYRLNNGGWTSAGSKTSVKANNKGVGSYSFDVRATNTGSGNTGPADSSGSVSVTKKPDPPQPSVTLSKGAGPYTQDGCSFGCFYYHVVIDHFSPGGHTVQFYCRSLDAHDTITADGSGHGVLDTQSGGSWHGYCGYDGAYVTVDGVKSNVTSFHP